MALSLGRLVTSIIIPCGGKGGRSQSAQRINSPSDYTLPSPRATGGGGGGWEVCSSCGCDLFVGIILNLTLNSKCFTDRNKQSEML